MSNYPLTSGVVESSSKVPPPCKWTPLTFLKEAETRHVDKTITEGMHFKNNKPITNCFRYTDCCVTE
jgi:hypothetical protein